jgi:hypothetical protein
MTYETSTEALPNFTPKSHPRANTINKRCLIDFILKSGISRPEYTGLMIDFETLAEVIVAIVATPFVFGYLLRMGQTIYSNKSEQLSNTTNPK